MAFELTRQKPHTFDWWARSVRHDNNNKIGGVWKRDPIKYRCDLAGISKIKRRHLVLFALHGCFDHGFWLLIYVFWNALFRA